MPTRNKSNCRNNEHLVYDNLWIVAKAKICKSFFLALDLKNKFILMSVLSFRILKLFFSGTTDLSMKKETTNCPIEGIQSSFPIQLTQKGHGLVRLLHWLEGTLMNLSFGPSDVLFIKMDLQRLVEVVDFVLYCRAERKWKEKNKETKFIQ